MQDELELAESAKGPSVEAARVLNLRNYTIRSHPEVTSLPPVVQNQTSAGGIQWSMAGMVQKLQTPQGQDGGFVTPQASEQEMGVDKDPKQPKHQAGLIFFWLCYLGELPERELVRVVFRLDPYQHYQHHQSTS